MRIGLLCTIIIFTIVPSLSISAERDSAIIRNSGSTNTSGYTITVWSDATARLMTPFSTEIPAACALT